MFDLASGGGARMVWALRAQMEVALPQGFFVGEHGFLNF